MTEHKFVVRRSVAYCRRRQNFYSNRGEFATLPSIVFAVVRARVARVGGD